MTTKIVPGCILSIAVDGEPEISHSYIVDETGSVRFVIADSAGENGQRWSVSLMCKDTAEARKILTASLAEYFKNPVVHVAIKQTPGLHVTISGEVQNPGAYVLPFGSHLSDLLVAAISQSRSDLTNILIRRTDAGAKTPGAITAFTVDLTKATPDDSEDPALLESDKVYVRRVSEAATLPAPLPTIRVVGEVNPPHESAAGAHGSEEGVSIPVSPGMKMKDLLERIGGLPGSADRSRLYLARLDGSSSVLDADKIDRDDPDQNIIVRAGDLIVVAKRDRSQVFAVLGEVNAPNTFEYRPGDKVHVLQAIARAGDLSKKADRHRAVLSKGYLLDPTKARQIPFDPDLVQQGRQPNMEIDPGDAVFIQQRKRRPTIWQQLLPLALHFLPF